MKTIPVRHIKTIQKEQEAFGSFSIRNVRDLLAGKDMMQDIHRHDYFLILALQKGKGKHEIDFTSYNVSDHSVFLLRPGQVHQLALKAGSMGYLVQFSKDFYYPGDKTSAELLRKASHTNLCRLNGKRSKKLFAVLAAVFEEYTDRKEGYMEVVKAHLGIFLIELVRQRQNAPSLKNINLYIQERLEEFLALLEMQVSGSRQVSYYAGRMHLTAYQLNAITKAALGKTSSALIDESIILEAKRQLLATSGQVTQIADHLGYDDPSYFIRFFKKHTGYSPEAFRKNFK